MWPLFHQVTGGTLVVAGLIVLPLPLPFGLIMLTIGLALLAPYFAGPQRVVRFLRRRFPKLNATLVNRRGKFPPVIQKTIDATHPFGL